MTDLPLIVAALLSLTMGVGFVAVLIGIRREDKKMSLGTAPPGAAASLARRVTGCHVRGHIPTQDVSSGKADCVV